MKCVIFLLVISVLAVNANVVHVVSKHEARMQECVENVIELLQKIVTDILNSVQSLPDIIADTQVKVDQCLEGVEDPDISDQIEIVRCMYSAYVEFRNQLFEVVFSIQNSIHQVSKIPDMIKDCIE